MRPIAQVIDLEPGTDLPSSLEEVTYAEPEELKAWEIGFKTEWLDSRLRLNGAIFSYDYTNQQFLNFDPNTGAQTVENADSSSIEGLELEVLYLPLVNFQISAGWGYLDTEFDELEKGSGDLAGNELITAPELNFNTALDYDIDFDRVRLSLHLDAVFIDQQF